MLIRELTDKSRIQEISELHQNAFPGFFLTQLGLPFLNTLYKGYYDDKESGIIVAENENKIVGFVAYSKDYSNFFSQLMKNRFLLFVWYAFLNVVHHPHTIKRLFGALGKSRSVKKEEKYVELASLCVVPEMEGRGIGSQLIDWLKSTVDFNVFSFISLETDAENNDRVNQFYLRNGFILDRTYNTAEGRKMNEYHFSPGATK